MGLDVLKLSHLKPSRTKPNEEKNSLIYILSDMWQISKFALVDEWSLCL